MAIVDRALHRDTAIVFDNAQVLEVPAAYVLGTLQQLLPGFADLAKAEANAYSAFDSSQVEPTPMGVTA